MDVFEAIENRRSVREYEQKPVSDDDLNKVLNAARMAPSWHNCQCWKFVVVKDDAMKAKLAEAIPSGNRASVAIKQAPVVIVACAEMGKSGYIKGELVSDKGEWWYMFDMALAMQNLTLAAYALGLGTLHVGWFDAKKVAELLNVPQGVVVVELMLLGYAAGIKKLPLRKELEEMVFYGTYGNK